MNWTIVREYWEQGSRPGRMKVNTTYNNGYVFEADSLEKAQEILWKLYQHAERISYDQVRFIGAYLFEGDVTDIENPFYNRKRWEYVNKEMVAEHRRFSIGSERPAFWANLSPAQQHCVALADRLSPEMANTIARTFQGQNMPI